MVLREAFSIKVAKNLNMFFINRSTQCRMYCKTLCMEYVPYIGQIRCDMVLLNRNYIPVFKTREQDS